MSIERQAAAGLKWNSIAKLLGQAVSWVVTLAVFRLLSPDDYGLLALSTVLLSIVGSVAELGLGSSLVQAATIERRDLARIGGALAVLNAGSALVVALGAPLFADALGDERLTAVLRWLSLQFVLSAFEAVPYSLAYRSMDYKRLAMVELATTLVSAVTTLLLALSGAGVWALVFGTLTGALARTSLYVWVSGFVWPSFDLRGIGPHVRFGGTVTLTKLLWQVTAQADILIAGRLFAHEVVGLYSVSMHLATLPMSKVMSVINQVAFPAVARLQDQPPRLRQRMLDGLRLLALAAVPAMWGVSSVAAEFVDVVLGDNWHPAILALQLVSFATPLRMLQMVLATALMGVGRTDLELRNTTIGAIVLPIAFLVGARFGLIGLASSWLLAVPVLLALNLPRTLPALGLSFADLASAVRVPVLAGAAMYVAVTAMRGLLGDAEELARLPVLIAVGVIVYVATVRIVDRSIWVDVRRLATALRS